MKKIPAFTHRDLCRAAARWLLDQRWCHVAGYEIRSGGGVLDAVGVSSPCDPGAAEAAEDEEKRAHTAWRGRVDAWAVERKGRRPPNLNRRWGVSPNARGAPRVVVVECKRTRSDLLADLREHKMRNYEADASDCYLAALGEVLPPLDELDMRGLPNTWGVLRVVETSRFGSVGGVVCEVVRVARAHRTVSLGEVRLWTYRIGKSLAYRVTRGSPVKDEDVDEKRHPDDWFPEDLEPTPSKPE